MPISISPPRALPSSHPNTSAIPYPDTRPTPSLHSFPPSATREKAAAMTTYMPSITIPSAVLQHPAASILLPIALGTAVGFATRRERLHRPRRIRAQAVSRG